MNGIDGLLTATGNDTRAQEAAAHSYALRNGKYIPLSTWTKNKEYLIGDLDIPITLGTVGGITQTHPQVKVIMEVLGNPNNAELSELVASMGLLQNLAANYTLVTKGISKAHGQLNIHNLVTTAGIPEKYQSEVAESLKAESKPSASLAQRIYEKILDSEKKF
jgi:hydroxymethylglutaryl-CoA reductase